MELTVHLVPGNRVCGRNSYFRGTVEKNSLEKEERKQEGKEEGPSRWCACLACIKFWASPSHAATAAARDGMRINQLRLQFQLSLPESDSVGSP